MDWEGGERIGWEGSGEWQQLVSLGTLSLRLRVAGDRRSVVHRARVLSVDTLWSFAFFVGAGPLPHECAFLTREGHKTQR